MNVIVAGATGGVGPEVVTQALAAGHHVTAYLRNPAKLAVTHSDFTVITGELTDRDAVRRAVHGADAIISALGPSLDRKVTGVRGPRGSRARCPDSARRALQHEHRLRRERGAG